MALTEEQQRLNEQAIQNTIDEWTQNQTSDKIKGLAEKNESFKGMTSPGRIDAQIESGVDFFDDVEGGARGFTPKTDLESLYNQAQNATFGPVEGEVDYYADLNPPSVSTIFQPLQEEGSYLVSPPFPSPSTIEFNGPLTTLNIDNNVFDNTLRIPGADGSDFMVTPILNQPTSFSDPSDSLTLTVENPNQPIENFNNDLRIPGANGSDFMVTPILGQLTSFSDPSDSSTLRIQRPNLPIEEFSNDLRIPDANGSDFMVTPILDQLTSFSDPSDSLTLKIEKPNQPTKEFSKIPRISGANNSTDPLSRLTLSQFFVSIPDNLFPSISSPRPGEGPFVEVAKFVPIFSENFLNPVNSKDHTSRFAIFGDPSTVNPDHPVSLTWDLDTSDNVGFDRVGTLDNVDTTWPDAALTRVTDRLKSYDGRITDATSQMVIDTDTILTPWPDVASTSKSSPTPYGITDSSLEYLSGESDENNPPNASGGALETLKENIKGLKTDYDDLFEYDKSFLRVTGDYTNVPSGLNTSNLFGTDSFRTVANKGPHEGKDDHPLILRKVGDNWGKDPQEAEVPGILSELGSSIFRGAPGLTGLIDRNLTDKVRISKYLLTPNGLSFLIKQAAFQFLNPDKGTNIYNPASVLGLSIPGFDGEGIDFGSVIDSALSAILPISHVERHIGGYRYEDNPAFDQTFEFKDVGRIANFTVGLEKLMFKTIPIVQESNTGFSLFDNAVNAVSSVVSAASAFTDDDKRTFSVGNPNRYSTKNLISSSPQTVEKGQITFIGGPQLVDHDVSKIINTPGGTFNKTTHNSKLASARNKQLEKDHSVYSYDKLNDNFQYQDKNDFQKIQTPAELNLINDGQFGPGDEETEVSEFTLKRRASDVLITRHLGEQGHQFGFTSVGHSDEVTVGGAFQDDIKPKTLGTLRGSSDDKNVDRINILPIFKADKNETPKLSQGNDLKDFIKFMFKDVVNKRYLVFRAILESISDAVTPEFTDTKFIGRPDKVYNYNGTDRNISFGFKIYPKTKQELPVLMEKLNYLIGLCYPSYTPESRMITPFVELTLGDMFNRAPGILDSLTVTVEDATTWEIDEGLQFPHFISCQCEFKYIGTEQNVPVALGKHYDIPWLTGNNRLGGTTDGAPIGTLINDDSDDKSKIIGRNKEFNYITSLEDSITKLNPVTE